MDDLDVVPTRALLDDVEPGSILDAFIARGDADHFARLVDNADVAENEYNLSVSSYVEERDDRVAGLEAGADDYLFKPVHPQLLELKLRAFQRITETARVLARRRDEAEAETEILVDEKTNA